MPVKPKASNAKRIRNALRIYRVTSVITGTFLLLLCAEVFLKFVLQVEIEVGGAFGPVALVARDTVQAFNLSTAILIVHGWFYVVYLFSVFNLWSLMRWQILRLGFLALGGIIPLLSFFLERRYDKLVVAQLAEFDATASKEPVVQAN